MITCQFENGNKTVNLRHVVIDALVLRNNQVLLEKRNAKLIEGGKWALAGGYVEKDETLIEALKREILEETGYRIKNIRLIRIIDNPNRPNEKRQNVAFIFKCQAGKKVGDHDWEVDEIQWFDLNNLPPKESIAFDHYDDIQFYKRNKNKLLVLGLESEK